MTYFTQNNIRLMFFLVKQYYTKLNENSLFPGKQVFSIDHLSKIYVIVADNVSIFVFACVDIKIWDAIYLCPGLLIFWPPWLN